LLRGGGGFSKGRKIQMGYDSCEDNMPHEEYMHNGKGNAWKK